MDWIKCTDRMPPKTMPVLVTVDAGEDYRPFVIPDARWNEERRCFEVRDDNESFYGWSTLRYSYRGTVTHWMPMPKPAED